MATIRITHCDSTVLLDTRTGEWEDQEGGKRGTLPFQAMPAWAATVRVACSAIWGPVYDTEESAVADGYIIGVSKITLWVDVRWEVV